MNQPGVHSSKPRERDAIRPIWGGFVRTGPKGAQRVLQTGTPGLLALPAPKAEAEPEPTRVGSMHAGPPHAPQTGTITLRLNSRAAATFAGFAGVGAFVLIVFLGSTVGLRPAAASGDDRAAHPQEVQPALDQDVTWSGGPAQTSLSVGEYGEQVAIATLTSSMHEVSNTSVTFYADPERSGNALQQFAEVFGEAIATGRNPLRTARGDKP